MTRYHVAAVTSGVLIALAAGAFYLRSSSANTPPPKAQPPATPVPVATVERSQVMLWDEFSGRLEAVERVDVRSRVAGAVQSAHFVEGALVKRGDLLVTIDPAPYAAEVDRAQAQVVAAQARLSYAKIERERAQRLVQERFIAQSQVDNRVNAEQEAEIAHPIHEERLEVGVDRRRTLVVIADQQVRDEAHRFPAEEELQEVVRHHQHQHREGEERDVREEPLVAPGRRLIVGHVADGINVHHP